MADDFDESRPHRRFTIPKDPPPYVPETPRFIDAPLREILAEKAKAEKAKTGKKTP